MKIRKVSTLASIISVIGVLFLTITADVTANTYECPLSPTEFQVSISNPDPEPEPGEFPADLDEIMGYVQENNINSVKELMDHLPEHMRKNYAFVAETRGLGHTSTEEPGLLLFGSDGRFMMNMDTMPISPRYKVVDMAYLNEKGDWEFKSLDFNISPPVLSPDGGNNGECRQCHGQGGVNSNGPMRPFWGTYQEWPGFFSDTIERQERVTLQQASVLARIENGMQNSDRFHNLITREKYFFKIDRYIDLPDRDYGISLTVANNEIGSAAAESIFKRVKRSQLYSELRDEYLALAYCAGQGVLSSEDRINYTSLIQSLGGSTEGITNRFDTGWIDIVRLWGLDPLHEFPLHKLTQEYATNTFVETRWNVGNGDLPEQLTLLILLDLAENNTQVDSILRNSQTSWEMDGCGVPFNNMKEYLQHKIYANYTLKGNARQLARSSYYDQNYPRFSQSMENVKTELCDLLVNDFGSDTSPSTEPSQPSEPIDDNNLDDTPTNNSDGALLVTGQSVSITQSEEDAEDTFYIDVPAGTNRLVISITGELSDANLGSANLYIRHGSKPTLSAFDCRPYFNGNNEICNQENPAAGRWYVTIVAFDAYSEVKLKAIIE
ncbi:MAG: PPC domain-containing protein [Methylococcales bacterium]